MGTQVALITASKNSNFPVGKYVVGQFGWRTHTISDGKTSFMGFPVIVLPDFGDLSLSFALGVLGMPGNTAYFGFLEICDPKPGETVVISGAAGAVGIIVGQIAKIKGCKVIGIAGSDEKSDILLKEFGFDHAINYKTQDIKSELERLAPEGIDCYFDNVGGEISNTVMNQMKTFGRVSCCGSISGYNEDDHKATTCQTAVIWKQLKMQGFQVVQWADRWNEGTSQNLEWVKQGKLKYKETITEGFENMFKAFTDMLRGGNIGKAIVKV